MSITLIKRSKFLVYYERERTCRNADITPISFASPQPASTVSFNFVVDSASSGSGGGGGGFTTAIGNGG